MKSKHDDLNICWIFLLLLFIPEQLKSINQSESFTLFDVGNLWGKVPAKDTHGKIKCLRRTKYIYFVILKFITLSFPLYSKLFLNYIIILVISCVMDGKDLGYTFNP